MKEKSLKECEPQTIALLLRQWLDESEKAIKQSQFMIDRFIHEKEVYKFRKEYLEELLKKF